LHGLRATIAPASSSDDDTVKAQIGMKYRGADSTINCEFDELGCSIISKPIIKSGISSTRMRTLTMNGASQARRFPHHNGNDAASATKAMAALQINGEILHTDKGPKKFPIGNTIANANNEVPMIARPLYINRFLRMSPPLFFFILSSVSGTRTRSHDFFREPNRELSCAAESDPREAERTSLPRTAGGSCRRLQRRAAHRLIHSFEECVVVHR
jgi:hypothetical protein